VGRLPAISDRDKKRRVVWNKAPVRVSFFYQVALTISGALVTCRRDKVSGHARCWVAVCSAAMEKNL
jgi:hypothetical protein